jgi:hypothetical protein
MSSYSDRMRQARAANHHAQAHKGASVVRGLGLAVPTPAPRGGLPPGLARYMWLRISLQGDGPLLARTPRPELPKRQCKSSTCADALYMRLVSILTPLTSCCSSHPHPPGYAAVTSLLLYCAYRSTHQHTSICKHSLMCRCHTTQPLLPCSTVQLPAMHTLT